MKSLMSPQSLYLIAIFSALLIQGCSTMTSNNYLSLENQRDLPSHQSDNADFNPSEAAQLLEFCIELNNQDDRKTYPENNEFKPQLGDWVTIFDTRKGKGDDPTKNGIEPFKNAWILLHNQSEQNQYAIAIRGTVSQADSILDDAFATTIAANAGIEFPKNRILPITFAATPRAEVHLGFAYGAFTLLFDKEFGILNVLKDLPEGSKLYITGHSQGAAITTLIHAFLHYAITDPNDRYGLRNNHFSLKSYVYAQPKPGNAQFALDFARIAGSRGAAFVINNNLDPVPRVPLSRETIGESIIDTLNENKPRSRGVSGWIVDGMTLTSQGVFWVRNLIAEHFGDIVPKLYKEESVVIDTHYFDGVGELPDPSVNSLNYTLAGLAVPVFGYLKGGSLYPFPPDNDKADWLLQHHATSYRKLINEQLVGTIQNMSKTKR